MGVDCVVKVGVVHRFHFALTFSMKNEIKKIGYELGMSMHDTIVFALETVLPVVSKYHFTDEESDGKPLKVDWETKAHVKLDVNFYRRIRMLLTQMHVFSVAIIVRKMLTIFIKYFRKGGLELVEGLMVRFERLFVKKYGRTNFFDKRKIQTQLSRISSNPIKYICSFNSQHRLITIKLKQ